MIKRKIIKAFLGIILAMVSTGTGYTSITLPEITNWELVHVKSEEITSSKGPQGSWNEFRYQREGRSVKTLILSGTAFGYPQKLSEPDKGEDLLSTGGTYDVIKIGRFDGLLESIPYIGVALSMRISKDLTVIVEGPEPMLPEIEEIALSISKGI